MFAAAKIARRRMKLEELTAKLEQIEQQASLTLSEYPRGLTVERQRLIVGIARQLRAHLQDQIRAGQRQRVANDGEAGHLHEVLARQAG